ncbi:hypothetical protein CEXT_808421 [Caerostris extrusa]|uniref:Uncharacterized protein n=1 Tax=Caerostris extrusa TaxID=172846 RepID=A0AAV4NAC7_CAEEX|nr:hypothetical protein CEXT_808421 [Caerostris extrusa]
MKETERDGVGAGAGAAIDVTKISETKTNFIKTAHRKTSNAAPYFEASGNSFLEAVPEYPRYPGATKIYLLFLTCDSGVVLIREARLPTNFFRA